MEPWYKVAAPRKEVCEGRSFNPDEFATPEELTFESGVFLLTKVKAKALHGAAQPGTDCNTGT
jgi:hypothetical protein